MEFKEVKTGVEDVKSVEDVKYASEKDMSASGTVMFGDAEQVTPSVHASTGEERVATKKRKGKEVLVETPQTRRTKQ